jgi:recombination protein RecR
VEFSSKIIEQAVNTFSQLPGVGKKTALRYVLHLIKQSNEEAGEFAQLIKKLKTDLKFCSACHNISESHVCDICVNPVRDKATVCIVQDYRDVMAIENTGLYKGLYHVLGGLISPMDGIGPGNLNIDTLIAKVSAGDIKEVILALNATMEGETTSFFVFKKLSPYPLTLSAIARGLAVGDELEYADEVTLGRSITNRVPFNSFFTVK